MIQYRKVKSSQEKYINDGGLINYGFFILLNTIFERLLDENLSLESGILIDLEESNQLMD